MMTTATSSSHIKPFRIVMSPLPGFSFALGWIGVLMPDAFDFDQKKTGLLVKQTVLISSQRIQEMS
jgi:hypothetical protein